MSSIFTYQDELPRIRSPWSTPGSATPQPIHLSGSLDSATLAVDNKTRLEPEKQDGPCEYKLHLLLRARRHFVSMTTTQDGNLATQIRPAAATHLSASSRSPSETRLQHPSYQPSPQSRQARLQQLTTQLLWRLQQSSPFHSSSNAELVLPILPEATPRLGVPDRPARLLPGLEESQGALYEIGVADDGTLVGLVEDELDESLNNLSAMAASLGCVVDILRKVAVGSCEWLNGSEENTEVKHRQGHLYVAEVLVRPDTRVASTVMSDGADDGLSQHPLEHSRAVSSTEQLRIALTGPSAAGKSSLLGTLTTSSLDNGRGKSRLSLLKHRHEIASGITSSVAHELLGYRRSDGSAESIINYASGDVSTWTDIHALADRLCFMSDSPGLSRFAKSTFRALVSWQPDWVALSLAADDGEVGSSQHAEDPSVVDTGLGHLDLCLKLGVRLVVVVTKMDLATKTRLRIILGRVLTCLKNAKKKPFLLSTASAPIPAFALDTTEALPDLQRVSPAESAEIDRLTRILEDESDNATVPIIMTSTVSGAGIGKIHFLLSRLPVRTFASPALGHGKKNAGTFHVDEVFSIPPVRIYNADTESKLDTLAGVVLCGRVERGPIRIGDQMFIGPFWAVDASSNGTLPRSKSLTSQDLRRLSLSASASAHIGPVNTAFDPLPGNRSTFIPVKVVSLRNLRLPVRQLSDGETGTIGIEPVDEQNPTLHKARKGMILASAAVELYASRGMVATFPARDFLVASPPLILGGHATAYINSIRAAVKVVALALVEDAATQASSSEVFAFDDDEPEESLISDRTVSITMRFVNSVEYVRNDDQVLVVPSHSAAGPISGPISIASGLMGFVGNVVDVVQ